MTRSYQVNDTYSVYNDIMHCFGCETEPNDFLRIHYKVTHMCGDINCPEHGKEVRLRSRVLPIFESSSIVDGKGHDRDIAQLQENYWARKVHMCKYCKKKLLSAREFSVLMQITN